MALETCPDCREMFTSTTAGDRHRVGKHHIFSGPERRRCLSSDEMLDRGMVQNGRGHWMSSTRAVA